MSRPPPSEPRVHALRTLASMLVRHGPKQPPTEPTTGVGSANGAEPAAPANASEPVRKAA